MEVILLCCFIIVVLILCKYYIIVEERTAVVVERLGKFHRILTPGIHFVIPILEEKVPMKWTIFENEKDDDGFPDRIFFIPHDIELVLDPPPVKCITSDKHSVVVDIVVHYKIEDVHKCVYNVEDMRVSLQKHIDTTLFKCVHGIDVMRLMNDREALDKDTTHTLNTFSLKWGVKILSVEIQGVTPPKEISQLLEQLAVKHQRDITSMQMESDRLEYEKMKISVQKQIDEVTHLCKMQAIEQERSEEIAKGQIKMARIEAKAKAKQLYLHILLGGDDSNDKVKYILEEMRLGEMSKIANGGNKTIFIPHEMRLLPTLM